MTISDKIEEFVDVKEHPNREKIKELVMLGLNGKLDGKVVECAYTDEMVPYPIALRDDKQFGNAYNTAIRNFENRMDPITKELIIDIQKQLLKIQTEPQQIQQPPEPAVVEPPRRGRKRLTPKAIPIDP